MRSLSEFVRYQPQSLPCRSVWRTIGNACNLRLAGAALVLFLAPVLATAAPSINGLAPATGPVGTSVTIAGNGFGNNQGSSIVTFNGVTGIPTNWRQNSIVVPLPTGANPGPVVVSVGGVASNSVTFTVTIAPSITTLTPSIGPVGTSVTIAGSDFGTSQGSSTVKFNGVTATATSWTATAVVA